LRGFAPKISPTVEATVKSEFLARARMGLFAIICDEKALAKGAREVN
jgi:hypothetical protein